MSTEYRNFLALPYSELEELNLQAKADRMNRVPAEEIREKRLKYLTDEKRIKAVTRAVLGPRRAAAPAGL